MLCKQKILHIALVNMVQVTSILYSIEINFYG